MRVFSCETSVDYGSSLHTESEGPGLTLLCAVTETPSVLPSANAWANLDCQLYIY